MGYPGPVFGLGFGVFEDGAVVEGCHFGAALGGFVGCDFDAVGEGFPGVEVAAEVGAGGDEAGFEFGHCVLAYDFAEFVEEVADAPAVGCFVVPERAGDAFDADFPMHRNVRKSG